MPKTQPLKIPRLPTSPSTTAKWQAIVNRDPTVTTFVYAVITTGIYCRPSCPARLARRANIKFYDTPTQASSAGFRACKRCKPDGASPQTELVQRACRSIEGDVRAGLKPSLQKLASEAGVTGAYFQRVFKRVTGVSPGGYAKRIREGLREDWSGLDGLVTESSIGTSVSGEGEIYTDAGGSMLWNEFDVLLAAEDEYVLGEVPMDQVLLPLDCPTSMEKASNR